MRSEDGDQNYPGAVDVSVKYVLNKRFDQAGRLGSLAITMDAKLADGETKSTPINMFNHSYFNLAGHDAPEGIYNHFLTIYADKVTPIDTANIPTREVKSLDEIPELDFR